MSQWIRRNGMSPGISAHKIGAVFNRKTGVNWVAYWATLISATVEQAAPTNVVLTFPVAQPALVATDFTIAGFTISSASWTGPVLTLVLSAAVVYGQSLTVTFVKTGGTAGVTNNVLFATLLTSTGTGAGVSTLRMSVSSDVTITLGANAKFYTDAAGTLNESATWTIISGALRTIYLKCTTGTAVMTLSDVTKVTGIGDAANTGWISSTNAASLTFDISKFTSLVAIRITGTSYLSGTLPNTIETLYFLDHPVYYTSTGALPSSLKMLQISDHNFDWTYNGALPSGLLLAAFTGTKIHWTYSGALPTNLYYLYIWNTDINWTYNGALPSAMASFRIDGSKLYWTYSGALSSAGIATLFLNGSNIDWTGLDIGSGNNVGTLNLGNYRITKMSSADMVTLLTQMTNRTGTMPATVTINDYADYASPPQAVIDAVAALKTAKSITTVNLGA